jgi:hypothetical protein
MSLRVALAFVSGLLGLILSIPILILGLPFFLTAAFADVVRRRLEPKALPWNQLIEFDAAIGWKPRVNLIGHGIADDAFALTTRADGWRGGSSFADSRIVVFGDSFAFGYGIDDRHMFTELRPLLPIKAIGAPGYNMVQELLLMRQFAPQLSGKLVVWFLFLGNDLYENLMPDMQGYRTPFVRRSGGSEDWEIVTSHVNPTPWPYSSRKRLYLEILGRLCRPNHLSDRVYSACSFLIKEANETCARANASLVVMSIPDVMQLSQKGLEFLASRSGDAQSFDPDFPDRQIAAACGKLGVAFIAGRQFLTLDHHQERDIHWNARGHQEIHKMLARLHQDYLQGNMQGLRVGLAAKPSGGSEDLAVGCCKGI